MSATEIIQQLPKLTDAERHAISEALLEFSQQNRNTVPMAYPPGHFYSPLVDPQDPHAILAVRHRRSAPLPAGIKFAAGGMVRWMERLAVHHRQFPFPKRPTAPWRYYCENPYFAIHDASAFFSMLLEFRPRRVIEVGCGYSSCLLLDTNDQFFDNAIQITLIDPSLNELLPLFGPAGAGRARCLAQLLQDVPLEAFDQLEPNDILFIDSSHVSKTGSDVNHYLFSILPRLRPGVLIHIHDILYPFEYLDTWVLDEHRSWNEAYLLRAFLQDNPAFEILYWANLAWHRLAADLQRLMPACLDNEGGSLWLMKTSS